VRTASPAIRCPRCRREAPRPAPFCEACGAPLLLGEEEVRPLDVTIDPPGASPVAPLRAEIAAPAPAAARAAPPLSSELHLDRRATRPPVPSAVTPPPRPPSAVAPPPPPPAAAPPAAVAPPPRPPSAAPAVDWEPEVDVEAVEVHVERAPPWRRGAAWALDALPFALAGGFLARAFLREAGAGGAGPLAPDTLLDLLARERVIVLSVAAAVTIALTVYVTAAHALAGATLGKRLLRLRVVGPDGARPSPARSAARSILAIASAAIVGLGFALALFTRSGRGLHDLLARTWVVKAP
jgi:uncharacterized RDD family membrane protein YckC